MNLIDALLGEHAALYALFDHVQRFVAGWDLAQAKQAGSMLESVLALHAQFEDELLFDTLVPEKASLAETLAAMRAEHRHIASSLSTLQEVEEEHNGRLLLRHVVELAREHFAVEERVLFSLAEQDLGPAMLNELGNRWAKARQLRIAG